MRCMFSFFYDQKIIIHLYLFVSRVTDNLWIMLIKRIKILIFVSVTSPHTQYTVSGVTECQAGLERFVVLASMKRSNPSENEGLL